MMKQSAIYLILSILVVFFAKYVYLVLMSIDSFYSVINTKLTPLFNQGGLSRTLQKTVLLVIIPILVALIPTLIYRLIEGKNMPYFLPLIWCLWIISVFSNITVR